MWKVVSFDSGKFNFCDVFFLISLISLWIHDQIKNKSITQNNWNRSYSSDPSHLKLSKKYKIWKTWLASNMHFYTTHIKIWKPCVWQNLGWVENDANWKVTILGCYKGEATLLLLGYLFWIIVNIGAICIMYLQIYVQYSHGQTLDLLHFGYSFSTLLGWQIKGRGPQPFPNKMKYRWLKYRFNHP